MTALLNCYRSQWQTEHIHDSLGQAKAGIQIITSPKYLLSTHTPTDSSYCHSEQPKSLAIKMCAMIINNFPCMQFLPCKEKTLVLHNSYCHWIASSFSWVLVPLLAIHAYPQEPTQIAQVPSYGNGVGVVLLGYDLLESSSLSFLTRGIFPQAGWQ